MNICPKCDEEKPRKYHDERICAECDRVNRRAVQKINRDRIKSEYSGLYTKWEGMKRRCLSPNHPRYHRYGGRGIRVCRAWRESFAMFRRWALAHGYEERLTIDREDNDGHYEPTNCRWVTRYDNNKVNRALTDGQAMELFVLFKNGQTKMSMARQFGISPRSIRDLVTGRSYTDLNLVAS